MFECKIYRRKDKTNGQTLNTDTKKNKTTFVALNPAIAEKPSSVNICNADGSSCLFFFCYIPVTRVKTFCYLKNVMKAPHSDSVRLGR